MPPKSAKGLAEVSARLCRLLRDEVVEQMGRGSPGLTALATDWRKLLFPQADDAQFADGYAQAVTFGLLVARSRDISLSGGIDHAAQELRKSNSLIATALRLLTDDVANQEALKTSLGTLTRVQARARACPLSVVRMPLVLHAWAAIGIPPRDRIASKSCSNVLSDCGDSVVRSVTPHTPTVRSSSSTDVVPGKRQRICTPSQELASKPTNA